MDNLPWFMRLSARPRVSYQVALEMHRALVGWPRPGGHGVKSQGTDYVASPMKMPRHEPCLTRSHMPICYMNKPSYLVPFMIALSWSSQLEHSESLSTSFFQLCLSFHTQLFTTLLASEPPMYLPFSFPLASRNFVLSPRFLQQHPCPHGLGFSVLLLFFSSHPSNCQNGLSKICRLNHTTLHPEKSSGAWFCKE